MQDERDPGAAADPPDALDVDVHRSGREAVDGPDRRGEHVHARPLDELGGLLGVGQPPRPRPGRGVLVAGHAAELRLHPHADGVGVVDDGAREATFSSN